MLSGQYQGVNHSKDATRSILWLWDSASPATSHRPLMRLSSEGENCLHCPSAEDARPDSKRSKICVWIWALAFRPPEAPPLSAKQHSTKRADPDPLSSAGLQLCCRGSSLHGDLLRPCDTRHRLITSPKEAPLFPVL